MKKWTGIFAIILMCQLQIASAWGQGYQPVTPLYSQPETNEQKTMNPLDVALDKSLGRIMVNVPTDNISFDQLESVIRQFPGIDKLQIQFPNQSQWMTSPAELLNVRKQFMEQADDLGFGVGGINIPELVFSSLTDQEGGLQGGIPNAKQMAMIPITNLKNAMSDTLEPMLKEIRYQQLALSDSLPSWLKDMLLAIYNFVMPYYYATVSWVSSFF